MYDVMIIGSGVSGSAAARELSRYKAKICVLEKEEDVCCGTSKANSGIVHAGYDAKEGSLMAKLNVRGNAMMEQLSKDLDFPFKRIGSLVICLREEDMDKLQALYDRGVANGVSGLQILNREEVLEMEPNIADNVYAALYAPTAGIVCPFGLNIAMAENACENGVEFKFDTEVKELKKTEDIWEVHTNQGVFKTKYVVNAAGVYADKFHNMVSEKKIHITPRRGDYCLLDKTAGGHVKRTIFALPNEFGKGILVSPTAHGNLLLGPTAIDIEEKEGKFSKNVAESLERVIEIFRYLVGLYQEALDVTDEEAVQKHMQYVEFDYSTTSDSSSSSDTTVSEAEKKKPKRRQRHLPKVQRQQKILLRMQRNREQKPKMPRLIRIQ